MSGLWRWQQSRLGVTFSDAHFAASHGAQKLVEGQRADFLANRAELLVGNQAFVGYMQLALGGALPGMAVDTSSIVDQLEERRDQFGLTVAAVLDSQGQLVVGTERFSSGRDLGAEPLFVHARDSAVLRDHRGPTYLLKPVSPEASAPLQFYPVRPDSLWIAWRTP
jgi:hypothetical protein